MEIKLKQRMGMWQAVFISPFKQSHKCLWQSKQTLSLQSKFNDNYKQYNQSSVYIKI